MTRSRHRRIGPPCACTALAAFLALPASAQEIAPFRLIDLNGSLSLGGWRDSQSFSGESPDSRTLQTDLRAGLLVNTRSYIYHPNLLTLDLGGGPIFERATFQSGGETTSTRETLYDLSARATFLQGKPYRGSVFYEHLNPTLSVAPGESLVTETTKYGFDASLLKPLLPVPVLVDAWRSKTSGRGLTRVIDDRTDQFSLRSDFSLRPESLSQFSYTHIDQLSSSGSPSLPIQSSDLASDSITLENQARFGDNRQWQLFVPLSAYRQRYTLAETQAIRNDNARASVDLRGDHREGTLLSYVRYDLNAARQTDSRSNYNSLGSGLTWTPDRQFVGSLGLRADRERATQIDADRYEATGSARWRRAVGIGTASAGYSTLIGHRDQRAGGDAAIVEGESLILSGSTAVTLGRPRVLPGSVVVNNAARTQVYVEGFDYTLEVVGIETRIRRVPVGNIANGESVLVDYRYDVGGTFAFRQFDNTFDLAWSLDSYATARIRYLDSKQTLISGQPTSPLNSARDLLVSLQVDLPFRLGVEMGAGALAEYENRRETILSFRRQLLQGYWQTLVPGAEWITFRAGIQRARTDYDTAESANVDLKGWDVSLWATTPWGPDFQVAYNDNRDDGGFSPRLEQIASARLNWRFRQLSLSLWGSYNEETQSGQTRTRKRGDFLLKREF